MKVLRVLFLGILVSFFGLINVHRVDAYIVTIEPAQFASTNPNGVGQISYSSSNSELDPSIHGDIYPLCIAEIPQGNQDPSCQYYVVNPQPAYHTITGDKMDVDFGMQPPSGRYILIATRQNQVFNSGGIAFNFAYNSLPVLENFNVSNFTVTDSNVSFDINANPFSQDTLLEMQIFNNSNNNFRIYAAGGPQSSCLRTLHCVFPGSIYDPLSNGDTLTIKFVDGSYNEVNSIQFNFTGAFPTPTPTPSTLNPTADSYIKQGSQNENEGNSTFLRLQSNGHNRALVKFDQSQIQNAVGSSTNYTAKLRFTISDNGNNWGSSGRTIEVHKLTQDWTEGNGFIDGNSPSNRGTGSGLTWNCAVDTNIANTNNDCSGSTAWNMDNSSSWPFIATATATALITNNQSGTVDFDVTSDIQSFINNSSTNYGWMVKKTDEGANGRVQFGSRQSTAIPQLIITPL